MMSRERAEILFNFKGGEGKRKFMDVIDFLVL